MVSRLLYSSVSNRLPRQEKKVNPSRVLVSCGRGESLNQSAGGWQPCEDWGDGLRGWMEVKHFIWGGCPRWLRAAPPDWPKARTLRGWGSFAIGRQELPSVWIDLTRSDRRVTSFCNCARKLFTKCTTFNDTNYVKAQVKTWSCVCWNYTPYYLSERSGDCDARGRVKFIDGTGWVRRKVQVD